MASAEKRMSKRISRLLSFRSSNAASSPSSPNHGEIDEAQLVGGEEKQQHDVEQKQIDEEHLLSPLASEQSLRLRKGKYRSMREMIEKTADEDILSPVEVDKLPLVNHNKDEENGEVHPPLAKLSEAPLEE